MRLRGDTLGEIVREAEKRATTAPTMLETKALKHLAFVADAIREERYADVVDSMRFAQRVPGASKVKP